MVVRLQATPSAGDAYSQAKRSRVPAPGAMVQLFFRLAVVGVAAANIAIATAWKGRAGNDVREQHWWTTGIVSPALSYNRS